MTTDPVNLVLRELGFAWHPGGSEDLAVSIDTFDRVVRELGERAWGERSVDEQAALLCAWLRRTADYLRDRSEKPLWRYRVAAAVAPRLILGRNVDETHLLRVARAIERDLSLVERLRRGLNRRRAKRARARLGIIVEKYQHPPESPNRWAYVLAAIDLAARWLPYYRSLMRIAGMPCRTSSGRCDLSRRRRRRAALCRAPARPPTDFAVTCPERPRRRRSFRRACVATIGACGDGDDELDVAPFVVVVADAYCPGLGHTLDVVTIREAVAAWRDLDQSKRPARGVKVERRPRHDPAWKIVKSLTGRKGSIANTARRWRELVPTVRPDPLVVIHGLVEMVPAPGPRHFVALPRGETPITTFVPRDERGAMWVQSLITAVHRAMPTRSARHASTSVPPRANGPRGAAQRPPRRVVRARRGDGPQLPEAFLVEAERVLPPVPRGARGPQPMSNREALPWVIHKFRSGCGWNELPNATTYHRRYQQWRAAGLERLRDLVAKHFILSPRQLMSLS